MTEFFFFFLENRPFKMALSLALCQLEQWLGLNESSGICADICIQPTDTFHHPLCKIRMPTHRIEPRKHHLFDSVECLWDKKLLKWGSIFYLVLPKGHFSSSTRLNLATVRTTENCESTSRTATDLRSVGMCNMSQDHSLWRGLVSFLSPSPFFPDLLWFWTNNESIV